MHSSPDTVGLSQQHKVGEILLSEGNISEEQLEEAVQIQKADERSLGEILVSLSYTTSDELARAISRCSGVEYVALSEVEQAPEVLGIISEDVLVHHKAVPLWVENGRLVVAMAEPDDMYARSDLTISAGYPITPVAAAEDAIRGLQERMFDKGGADRGEQQRLGSGGKIGEILLSEGKISEEQLERAVELHMKDPRDLGKVLLSLGYVVQDDLARALARRLKLDYVVLNELSEDEVDPSVLSLIGEVASRKYMALPLRFQDGDLVIAMSDPNDIYALEDLRLIAGHPIKPVVATEEDLQGAFDHLFDTGNGQHPGEPEPEKPEPEEPGQHPEEPEPEEPEIPNGFADVPRDEPESRPKRGGGGSLVRLKSGSRNRKVAIGGGRIGDILVTQGKITEQQLEHALLMQKDDPREIGKLLLALDFISNTDLMRALAERLRLDYVELTERDVDRAVANLVDQKVLRKHGVVPLRLEENRLVVAMSDPTNIYALEDLMVISGYPVTPVIALQEEIERVLSKVFAMTEEVSEFLEEAKSGAMEADHGDLDLGEASPGEAPIIRLVSAILQQAVGDGASDIHIEPQAKELMVRMRVDGVLREAMSIPPKLQAGVLSRLKILANLDISEKRIPQDGRFSVKLGGQKVDLRVASLPTVYGEKIVLRLLDTSKAQVPLPKLGFSKEVYEKFEEIFHRPYGAILVTGPTGSGKSTTLYATLNELNSPEKNVITVEDPVEYRMRGINQIQVNPKAGLTFASSLKSILRADPDIVMIGEIRDHETAKIAVEASLTGHLVLATLHTNNAPGALSRLTDMDVEPFLTASAVDCVIAQRLARRLCDRCKEPVEIEEEILAGMGFPFHLAASKDGLDFHKAVGCNWCGNSGYKGRVGIYELMVVNQEIRELILKRASTSEVARVAGETGMIPLREDGLLKAAQGTTTIEEVLRTVV